MQYYSKKKTNKCINCNIKFGEYFCNICSFYDNKIEKDYYHCDKCNICRVGKKNTFHCDNCKICVINENHKCHNIKNIHSNCPICLEDLFSSINPVIFLNCGHSLHRDCFNLYAKTNYKCPICKKSICDVNHIIEEEVNNTLMSEELQRNVNIICNDCEKKSEGKFHIVAIKCKHCNSYNTNLI